MAGVGPAEGSGDSFDCQGKGGVTRGLKEGVRQRGGVTAESCQQILTNMIMVVAYAGLLGGQGVGDTGELRDNMVAGFVGGVYGRGVLGDRKGGLARGLEGGGWLGDWKGGLARGLEGEVG